MPNPETEYTGPGTEMSAEIMEILQTGMDFGELQKSTGHQRLMTFLKGRAEAALQAMREAPYASDQIRLGLMLEWQFCEDVIRDLENHIHDSIQRARNTIKDVNVSELAREGFVLRFGVVEDE